MSGQILAITHNFIRIIALLDCPTRPQFAKAIRKRFVFIPGKLISFSKQMWMKIPNHWKKEVDQLLRAWERAFILSPTVH